MSDQCVRRRRVARFDDLMPGEATAVAVDGRELALYRVDAAVYATDNLCSHGEARLCDGFLEGYSIECPLHQATFDIRSGAATRAPAQHAIATFPVEVVDGEVYILADSASA